MRVTLNLVSIDDVFDTVKVVLEGTPEFVAKWKRLLMRCWRELH